MVKWTHTYYKFDGTKITRDFYFNLTQAEAMELEYSRAGGLSAFLTRMSNESNSTALIPMIKTMLLKAYGERSDDGEYFIKNSEVANHLRQSNAYSDLFMKLATDADFASKFMNALVPNEDNEVFNIVSV